MEYVACEFITPLVPLTLRGRERQKGGVGAQNDRGVMGKGDEGGDKPRPYGKLARTQG